MIVGGCMVRLERESVLGGQEGQTAALSVKKGVFVCQ